MEPLVSATAFATVISLISQFRSERGASKKLDTDEFMAWLSENRHEEIKDLLELNTNTTISIKALLTVNHVELANKLDALDKALAIYASGSNDFSDLVNSIKPRFGLSSQAVNILKQLDESGGNGIVLAKSKIITLHILGGNAKQIIVDEHRFLEDDLKTLEEYKLLRYEIGSNGSDIYLITRIASELVATL